jgi:hypothetical protein
MIKERNIRHNTGRVQPPETGKMINGQARGSVAKMKYGICPMSFNGCEVIAVHNALVYLGKPRELADIAAYMESFRMLFGVFGCSPYKIGRALKHFGVDFQRTENPGDAGAFIVTFWTKHPFLSTIHTVFCIQGENGIEAYNYYNNSVGAETFRDMEELAGKRRPIAVYTIKKQN